MTPEVSVVMGVYNGYEDIEVTVQSVISQKDVSFEFIIVDDGSTDGTFNLLQSFSKNDPRIHLIRQENLGLTEALIKGCSVAKGEFIARQDVGDISLRRRLAVQSSYLRMHPKVVLVSCGTRQVAPDGEILQENIPRISDQKATGRLRNREFSKVRGITHHGTAMFRKSAYNLAGGYRCQFYFAQDLDLWRRITDYGYLSFVPDILYQSNWDEGSISASCYNEQKQLKKIIVDLSKLRADGKDESLLLSQAMKIRPPFKTKEKARAGDGYYFIARMLQGRNDSNARKYLLRALEENRFHWRSWIALLR